MHQNHHIFRVTIETEEYLELASTNATISSSDNTEISGSIVPLAEKQKDSTGQIEKTFRYFAKQFRAVWLPLSNASSRQKFFALGSIYTILSFSFTIGSFFVRGWQLGVIGNLATRKPVVAPSIHSLTDVGNYIKDGITLVFAKFLYDLPKYLFIVIFGYELIEALLDCAYWFFDYQFGSEKRWILAYAREEIAVDMGTSLLVQFILYVSYSFLVTPTFKIQSIKYAVSGNSNWALFFNLKEIVDSFKIYRSQPRSTLQAYLWDIFITTIGNFISLILYIFPMLGAFAALFYRFAFLHWPKGYGYGTLARKLIEKRLINYDTTQQGQNSFILPSNDEDIQPNLSVG